MEAAGMNPLRILPMAIVMVAGPQMITAIMLATSQRAKANSAAFLAGVTAATTIAMSVFYLAAVYAQSSRSPFALGQAFDIAVVVLLLVLALVVYRRRSRSEPPSWMGKLQDARPGFSFRIGFILFLVMPTDVITMFVVANVLASQGEPWVTIFLLVAATVMLAGIPLFILLAFGHRAEHDLPRLRHWTTTHSWIVNEAIIGVFLVMSLRDVLPS
ncbi:MAG: hypothetical protein EXQ71_05215 [Acidimicrobiia bacterium]|nr:hypothetical protein [Acidimicrobiia bacterium]